LEYVLSILDIYEFIQEIKGIVIITLSVKLNS
jgi:hypothetical protein